MTHILRAWPQYFGAVADGRKTFEIRRDDRNFAVGDQMVLCEWCPDTGRYTGWLMSADITYITDWEQRAGFVVMSIVANAPIRAGLTTTRAVAGTETADAGTTGTETT